MRLYDFSNLARTVVHECGIDELPEKAELFIVGAKFLNDVQREDVALAFGDLKNAGLLDLVAAWYVKAARYIRAAPAVRADLPVHDRGT